MGDYMDRDQRLPNGRAASIRTAEEKVTTRLLFGDAEMLQQIIKSESPRGAKALGRKVQNVHADEWGAECFEIVVSGSDWASIRIRDQLHDFPIASL